jgi:hypothetical protein
MAVQRSRKNNIIAGAEAMTRKPGDEKEKRRAMIASARAGTSMRAVTRARTSLDTATAI